MPGILAIVGAEPGASSPDVAHQSIRPMTIRSLAGEGYFVQQFVNPKFPEDKLLYEDPDVLLALDGVILNLEDLRRTHRCGTKAETIKKMYQEGDDRFFKSFRGEFSGLLYDKARRKWLFFTNHTGSKSLFFYHDAGLFLCASELKVVTQLLKKWRRRRSLDTVGAYLLLTYGYMLEDYTLVEEVKKLKAGHYLEVGAAGVQVRCYHRFENDPPWSYSKGAIIDTLEGLFREAVRLEYQKDAEYGYRHVATLSGGLDSRMAVMVAKELGYDDILNVTFAQSCCVDATIAQQIAADLHNEFLFYALDNGTYLLGTMPAAVTANDGLVLWTGSAHGLAMMRKLDFSDYGLMHTGQLGDAVLGTYLSAPQREKPRVGQGAYSERLLGRIENTLTELTGAYDSEELFLLYNRGFNGMANGNWTFYQFTECASPFLNVDFLDYALKIPPNLKWHEGIYQDWLLQRHPRVAQYVWEKAMAPLSAGKIERYLRRQWQRLLYHVSPRRFPYSMNPFREWYEKNRNLRDFFDGYFDRNVEVLDNYPELREDCRRLYQEGTLLEKSQVMTLCEAAKLHFR